MDKAKLRLFAGATGVLFGFAGVVSLTVALVIALSSVIGLVWATVTAGFVFFAIASFSFYFFLLPGKGVEEEIGQFESATANALADLPFDTIKALIDKRPVTVATVAAVAGYMIVKQPEETVKTVRRVLPFLL